MHLEFKLVRVSDHLCGLKVVEQNGNSWWIGTITEAGRLRLHAFLPTALGLSLDSDGRIITEQEQP